MCGIAAIFSPNKKTIDYAVSKQEEILKMIRPRGPDKTSIIKDKNFVAIHTLLSITGRTKQPVVNGNFLLLFNGEIYNDHQKYGSRYSDVDYLVNQILDNDTSTFPHMDGEFAICLKLFPSNKLVLATDPFGTKPLYYQFGSDYCVVGTYYSTVAAVGKKDPIQQVPANTLVEISLTDFVIKKINRIREFDFSNQTTKIFDKWNHAFKNAILKRTKNVRHNCFISFSSGHDSGLIAAEMLENKIPFSVYSVKYKEDMEILDKRLNILKKRGIPCEEIEISREEYLSMKKYLLENLEQYLLINPENLEAGFKDPDMRKIPGFIAYAIINQKASIDKRLISLSGQGCDEIISDYYNVYTHSQKSEFKGNFEKMTCPWKNFYGGWNRLFLGASERIAGLFGIETRYPFLDYDVIQEFLNLHPKLKSQGYKAPATNRLIKLGFPYHMKKYGFAGYGDNEQS